MSAVMSAITMPVANTSSQTHFRRHGHSEASFMAAQTPIPLLHGAMRQERWRLERKSTGIFYMTAQRPASHQPIDVLAIHGLGRHYLDDFTHAATGANWVRDWLPRQLPEARIMSWGYRSYSLGRDAPLDLDRRDMKILDKGARNGTLVDDPLTRFAEDLLLDLDFARREGQACKRPLLVVAYSFGGLVFKRVSRIKEELVK